MIRRGPSQVTFPEFRPRFPWIGGDLQTIRNFVVRAHTDLSDFPAERLTFPTNDGSGDVLAGVVNRPKVMTGKPLAILIHGLTGCEDSQHIRASARTLLSNGYPVLRINQRGAGPSRATCRRHYHAGLSQDLVYIFDALPRHLRAHGVVMMGVSLGANVLLKCLAEIGQSRGIKSAVAISPPVDLAAAQERIMARRNAPYHRYLLNRMKADIRAGANSGENVTTALVDSVTSVYDFDDRIIAPANGFRDAEDYYRRSSSLPLLSGIKVPTLIIHPQNDPWVPVSALLNGRWSAGSPISLLCPRDGGHVGCHSANLNVPWHDHCALVFFAAHTA